MAHDVFISHSSNNRTVANAACAALESAGVRCWIAPRDVMPGRSYSGEITRAIQQSRAFILIFSEHSNNSEQVLREVQLAANSRLHIVQFRIDAVMPSDDLEYYLSGPHWLDAVTPPLENHLEQLKSSMKALLALPRTAESGGEPRPAEPAAPHLRPPPPPPASPPIFSPPLVTPTPAKPGSNAWKWVALGIAGFAALGLVAFVIIFALIPKPPPIAPAPSSNATPAPQSVAAVQPKPSAESTPEPHLSAAPPATSSVVSAEEAERYVKEFNRDMERGDLPATIAYLDDTVDYYAFGPKPKAFIADQMRQYFAAVPVRAFVVGEVKVQPGPKPTVATVIFDTRYSIRDALGTQATGKTRTEWDLVRRPDGLKLIRTNWITYPDATPSR
ncbi:MAG: toll/interleukin-1 receptor domain-containing protein [Chthoniobacterales bacterium]